MQVKRYGGRSPCPHCGSAAPIRSVRKVSPTFFEHYMRCSNLECGWTGVANFIIERTIVQSAIPRPNLSLPMAPPRVQRRAPNGMPLPANDDALEQGQPALGR